jgi:hypothetical protein
MISHFRFFASVGGNDVYRAVYQNAPVTYTIRPSPSGKISLLLLQPAFRGNSDSVGLPLSWQELEDVMAGSNDNPENALMLSSSLSVSHLSYAFKRYCVAHSFGSNIRVTLHLNAVL